MSAAAWFEHDYDARWIDPDTGATLLAVERGPLDLSEWDAVKQATWEAGMVRFHGATIQSYRVTDRVTGASMVVRQVDPSAARVTAVRCGWNGPDLDLIEVDG